MESKDTTTNPSNPGEWCWLNGAIMPLSEARISVEDRGFQFADGVYESIRLYNGQPFELNAHLARLERSCAGIRLAMHMSKDEIHAEMMKLVKHSGLRDGFVYLQLTRGSSERNHLIPKIIRPTLLFYVRPIAPVPPVGTGRAYTLLSVTDERWNKCWIKSIALLENVLARNAAAEAGADEAVFIHNGHVTEGTSSNIFMIKSGTLVTHPLGPRILPGVTRDIVLSCAKSLEIAVEERAMPLEEAKRSDEVIITSSTRELVWVDRWDDARIGTGACGDVCRKLHEGYRKRVIAATS